MSAAEVRYSVGSTNDLDTAEVQITNVTRTDHERPNITWKEKYQNPLKKCRIISQIIGCVTVIVAIVIVCVPVHFELRIVAGLVGLIALAVCVLPCLCMVAEGSCDWSTKEEVEPDWSTITSPVPTLSVSPPPYNIACQVSENNNNTTGYDNQGFDNPPDYDDIVTADNSPNNGINVQNISLEQETRLQQNMEECTTWINTPILMTLSAWKEDLKE